jgi:hypothetical protein
MALLMKLSSQRQLTLPKVVWQAMGSPLWFEAQLVRRDLVLRHAEKMTLEQAERVYGRHGITQDVMAEALKIVAAREKEAARDVAKPG